LSTADGAITTSTKYDFVVYFDEQEVMAVCGGSGLLKMPSFQTSLRYSDFFIAMVMERRGLRRLCSRLLCLKASFCSLKGDPQPTNEKALHCWEGTPDEVK
jgi:hypothetical protein